jgi:long-chain acyl-CoA synthetase
MTTEGAPRKIPIHPVDRDWTEPAENDPRTISDLLRKSVEKRGHLPAFGTIPGEGMPRVHITYSEFGDLVNAAAASLRDAGVQAGDRLVMILDNSVEWAATAYSANSIGAVYTGMYTNQHGGEWAYIIADSTPSIVLVKNTEILDRLIAHMPGDASQWPSIGIILLGEEPANRLPPEGVTVLAWTDFIQQGRAAEPISSFADDPHALATLIYTSGTTGSPKGVMISNWNMLHNITAMQGRYPIYEGDRTASFLPWAHVFGQMGDLHYMIHHGIHINLISDVLKIADECQVIKPHAMFAVPRVWNKLYDKVLAGLNASPIKKRLGAAAFKRAKARIAADGRDCIKIEPKGFLDKKLDKIVLGKVRSRFGGEMRFCISGGSALSPEVASFIQCVGFSMFEGYGLTETSPLISINGWEEGHPCMLGSVGRPVPGVRVEIDPDAWDDPDSEDGEIVVYGPNIMQGYWNDPEATAEVMTEDGGIRTGDLGRLENGFVRITGRVKEQFKLENGKYVAPSPLEESLKLSALVEQCCVDGRNMAKTFTLVHPVEEELRRRLAAAGKGSDASFADLCVDPGVAAFVLAELQQEIMQPNWKGFEISGAVVLDAEEWSTDNELLTPSLKVKRAALLARHEAALANL